MHARTALDRGGNGQSFSRTTIAMAPKNQPEKNICHRRDVRFEMYEKVQRYFSIMVKEKKGGVMQSINHMNAPGPSPPLPLEA